MKHLSWVLVIALFSSLLLVSCGKTSEQKQVESDLNKRLMALHDSDMVKMRQAQGLDAQLDSALALHDSLAAKYPKEAAGQTRDDIDMAKQKLAAAQAAMHAWMAAHKPYDPEMKHEEAMKMMNAEFQDLANVSAQMDSAIVDATGTVENHRKVAAELLAKKPLGKSRK